MIYRVVVSGLLFAAFACPQSNDLDRAFSELQRVWRTADSAAAGKLFSDDLNFITRFGISVKKEELVSSFRPNRDTMQKVSEKKTQMYGNFAVVSFKDGEGDNAARRTILWHKTQDGWKVVSMQTTPIRP